MAANEWSGLYRREGHNPGNVEDEDAYCIFCMDHCYRDEPCRCCLLTAYRRLCEWSERGLRHGFQAARREVRAILDGGSDNCNANLGMADYPWWQQREGRVDD